MKKLLAVTFCLLSVLLLKAQSTINCDSLIKKKYKISELKNNPQFLEDVKTAILCRHDSLDMHIFMGPNGNLPLLIIGPLGMKRIGTPEENIVSLKELIELFSSLREKPDYEELRNKAALFIQAKKMGMPEQLSENLPQKENKNERAVKDGDKLRIVESVYGYTDYTKGLSKAKESGKPVLLYFSAYTSIPARKFDHYVLRDAQIQDIITKRFEVIILSVDDVTPLAKDNFFYSKSLKRKVNTLGDVYLDLQMDKFGSDVQPMFFILDKTGKKLASSGATGVKEFIEFLSL